MLLYAFMINPSTVFAVLENGKIVERKEVVSVAAAKEHLMSDGFEQIAKHASGGEITETRWIDDLGADDKAQFVCLLYDKRKHYQDDKLVDCAIELFYSQSIIPEKFEYMLIDFDRCIEDAKVKLAEVAEQPKEEPESEGEPVADQPAEVTPEPERSAENSTPKSSALVPPESCTIEVDHVPTDREKELIEMIFRKQNLKMELAGIQAEMNKEIKELDKAIYDYASGKCKRHVKASYVYHWGEGVRDVVNTESGEVVRTENIPVEFMQLEADLPMPEQLQPAVVATKENAPAEGEDAEAVEDEAEPEQVTEDSAGTGEEQPEENTAVEAEIVDCESENEAVENDA